MTDLKQAPYAALLLRLTLGVLALAHGLLAALRTRLPPDPRHPTRWRVLVLGACLMAPVVAGHYLLPSWGQLMYGIDHQPDHLMVGLCLVAAGLVLVREHSVSTERGRSGLQSRWLSGPARPTVLVAIAASAGGVATVLTSDLRPGDGHLWTETLDDAEIDRVSQALQRELDDGATVVPDASRDASP